MSTPPAQVSFSQLVTCSTPGHLSTGVTVSLANDQNRLCRGKAIQEPLSTGEGDPVWLNLKS